MALLQYSIPDGYKMYAQNNKFYIAGSKPKRRVTISENTYRLLEKLCAGEDIQTAPKDNKLLFYLAHKNYLAINTKPTEFTIYPLISVIIPVKDRANDLSECLNSLQNLCWPKDKLEIIVIDDGSRDESPLIAEQAGAVVIRNPESLGPAAARNKGAQIANGEFLAFIDSDCIAERNWL